MCFHTLVFFVLLVVLFPLVALCALLRALEQPCIWTWMTLATAMGGCLLAKGPVLLPPFLSIIATAPWWSARRPYHGWPAWFGSVAAAVSGSLLIALTWALPAVLRSGQNYGYQIF